MRFRAFGIPVRLDLTFLVIVLIGGFRRLEDIAAWSLAAFLAVLAHELGHALTARAFGVRGISITLFALGGVTTYPAVPRLAPGRQFLVSAAGSAVGLVVGGAAFVLGRAGVFDGADRVVIVFVSSLVWVGAVFGLFNWLPIRPLDGGQMMTSLLELATDRRRADTIARVVSLGVGSIAAVLAFMYLTPFAGVFVILITLAGLRSGPREPDTSAPSQTPPASQAPASPPPAGGASGMDTSAYDSGPQPPQNDESDPFPI
jgi:Zn-dependent protease